MGRVIRDLISVRDFPPEYISEIVEKAKKFYFDMKCGDDRNYKHRLEGYESSEIFGEVSTRTHGSTFKALTIMGASHPYGIADPATSSLTKGETLADTVDTFTGYGTNFLVMRDSREGSARWARIAALRSYSRRVRAFAEKCYKFPTNQSLPMIINGGDGPRNHPTQFLLDCATMNYHFGRHQDLTIGYINDPASRVFSSHADAAAKLGWKIYSFTPPGPDFELKKRTLARLNDTKADFKEIHDFKEFLGLFPKFDVLYVNRLQKNFRTEEELKALKTGGFYPPSIGLDIILSSKFRKNSIIMHAKPIDKNEKEIDDSLRYHPLNLSGIQSDFGVPARMASVDHVIENRLLTSLEGIIASLIPEDFAYEKIDLSQGPSKKKTGTDYTTAYIQRGYVIDHIPLGCGGRIEEILKQILPRDTPVIGAHDVQGDGEFSRRKDVIKIHGAIQWNDQFTNIVALFTDSTIKKSCRVSRFEEGKRVEKWAFRDYETSDTCANWNPKNTKCGCITNESYREGIRFKLLERPDGSKECPYCDTIQGP